VKKLEEKKQIKLSLGTVICIFIIIILIISLCVVYYLGFVKNNQKVNKTEIQNKEVEVQKNELDEQKEKDNKTDSDISILSNSEIQSILGPDEAKFCIENIEKSGTEYIITAYMLENNSRIISKTEYETLKNGGEITFRNQKWKISNPQYADNRWEYIKSGNDELSLSYDSNTGKGFLTNTAGVETNGLHDYSTKKIQFKVSENIIIGEFWWEFKYDDNGKIVAYDITTDEVVSDAKGISFDELLELSDGCKGTYDECTAYVKNGVVGAIKIYEK
jgi:hypothetical protein